MENESKYNPEIEKPLEELTEEGLIKMMEKEESSRCEKLCDVLSELVELSVSAEMAQNELRHLISEPNHRIGENAYDSVIFELSKIETTIKKHFPNGKFLF